MKLFINIILLLIMAICIWRGCKKGFVSGIVGILAVIIALYGGSLLSSKYAGQVIPVLEPFVDGYVDSQKTRSAALEKMGYGDSELSLEDVLAQDSSLRYDYAFECAKSLGFNDKLAERIAEKSVNYADKTGENMTESVISILCDTISYVGGLLLAFLLILILLVAITNIGNLSFKFPKMPMLDYVGGGVMGLIKGFLYCSLFCWILGFFGIIIGADTLDSAALAKFFMTFDFITGSLI